MSKLARDHRNSDIVRIQIARRQLRLSDEDYHTIIAAQGNGAASSKDLDHEGRQRVLRYLERTYGLSLTGKPFGQPEKIAWLWRKLDEAGALRDASREALLHFIERTVHLQVSHPKLLPPREASKVIEALKAMLKRAGKAPQPQQQS